MKNLISFVIVAHLVSSTDAFQSARNVSLRPIKPPKLHSKSAFQRNNHDRRQKSVYVTTAQSKLILQAISANTYNQPPFSLPTALFLAGLAFNAYTEPPPNSSRWERGSSGLNVAFLSSLYTRSLYSGIIEVTPLKASDLPDEDDAAESLITGGGVDASLLVGVVEGAWSEDVKKLEKEQFHNGVLDLAGCAHVGRSSTAWSNVDEKKAKRNKEKGGSGAYHIKSSWGRGGQAVWEGDPPFYLYVQEPKDARLVFTLFDEDVVGEGRPIGSAYKKLVDLLPESKSKNNNVEGMKSKVIEQLRKSGKLQEAIKVTVNEETGEEETMIDQELIQQAINDLGSTETTASIKMTSKPRIKDKGGQRALAMAAGAMMAGPAGAAVGGVLASFYEGEVRGRIEVKLKYMPILQDDLKLKERGGYEVKGGLPGVTWGKLYDSHVNKESIEKIAGDDFEFCCVVTHDSTGCTCAIYRSLEKRMIAVSFRGTCAPIDLVTDASIAQEAWVEGDDVEKPEAVKVHSGFRKSLNSISRRLKELVLAAVAPGEDLSQYDLLVSGHSLGGALATCFTLDLAEYGVDAGRGLPQLEASEDWWSSIASTLTGLKVESKGTPPPPPRPKSLKMYNFGSPRVGNDAFCRKFDSFIGKEIDEAYRIVNDQDVVARFPRTVNALALGSIGYDHCGPTVLITELASQISKHESDASERFEKKEMIWIEGTDNKVCPVRDGNTSSDPLGSGTLLGDIVNTFQGDENEKDNTFNLAKLTDLTQKVTGRLQKITADDITSLVGVDKNFSQREIKVFQSIFSGRGLSHHMEDKYYQGMGMCCGFVALPEQELMSLEELENDEGAMAEIEEMLKNQKELVEEQA